MPEVFFMRRCFAFLLRFSLLPALALASIYLLNRAAAGFDGSAVAVLAPTESGWLFSLFGEDYFLPLSAFFSSLARGISLLCGFFSIVRDLIL